MGLHVCPFSRYFEGYKRIVFVKLFLQHSEAEGNGLLWQVVTGDECQVQYFPPETNWASTEWRHSPLKPETLHAVVNQKIMLLGLHRPNLVTLYAQGNHYQHYMPRGTTINIIYTRELLSTLYAQRNHYQHYWGVGGPLWVMTFRGLRIVGL